MQGLYGPQIEVDICFCCHAIWLDKQESLQLSPRGTLDLFKVLHEHRDDPRHALQNGNRCPRCERRLSLSHDIGKAGRFSYYSCPARDGRLTPFSEFLKEKQFVRSLNPAEQQRVKAEVKSVQCSSCGAPVDLAKGFQCGHCGSPITVLDAEAVQRTLEKLEERDADRSTDPAYREERARAIAAMEAMRSHPEDQFKRYGLSRPGRVSDFGVDLLIASVGALFDGF